MKLLKGAFIVVEGIDGAGKTTLCKKLESFFLSQNIEVIFTREPSDLKVGKLLREYLKRKELPAAIDALLFAADRVEHVHSVINPNKNQVKLVLSDRYKYSSLAYQSSQGLEFNWIRSINQFAPDPDLVLFLNIPPALALQRIQANDKFEKLSFLEKVQANYLKALPNNTIFIDATRTEEEVFQESLAHVQKFLTQHNFLSSNA